MRHARLKSCAAGDDMKSTHHLIQEHKVILRALDVLDEMTAFVEAEGKVDKEDTDKILDFLRWFADAHHQAKEETILFPAMKAHDAREGRLVHHMMFEHEQERQSIEDLEKEVRLGRLSELASRANRLSSALRNHIYKEDEILFPAADALLTPQEDEVIVEQLNHFETPLDLQILDHKLHDLRSLEWKYLRR
jgi:hemerythrin-like domain-containing protein